MDAKVEERPDGLKVEGWHAGKLRGAEIERAEITASRWRLPWRDWQLRADRDSRCRLRRCFVPELLQ